MFDIQKLTLIFSTGGIIALGLGIEAWSIDKCIDEFEKFCSTAFTPRAFHSVPGLKQLSIRMHNYSKYKTKPLEKILKSTFSVADQPIFGGQQNHLQSSVKVAVTATSEIGEQALLLTNYNRSHMKDDQSKCKMSKFSYDAKICDSGLYF